MEVVVDLGSGCPARPVGGCGTGLLSLVWLVRLFERWEVLEFVVVWPDAAVEFGEVLKFWSS